MYALYHLILSGGIFCILQHGIGNTSTTQEVAMEVIKDTTRKFAEIWVPNGTDETLVQEQYLTCKQEGLQVAIYRSGRQDLLEMTKALLHANR